MEQGSHSTIGIAGRIPASSDMIPHHWADFEAIAVPIVADAAWQHSSPAAVRAATDCGSHIGCNTRFRSSWDSIVAAVAAAVDCNIAAGIAARTAAG